MPINMAETMTAGKLLACDKDSKPTKVKHMPNGSEYGLGRLSVYRPMAGCSNEAVNW